LKKAALLEQQVKELKNIALEAPGNKDIVKRIIELDNNDISPSSIPYWKKVGN